MKKKNTTFLFAMSVASLVVFAPAAVDALTFTPDRLETEVYPGVPVTQELTLLNEIGSTLSVSLRPVQLDASGGESGSATFLLNTAGSDSLSWVSVSPSNLVLKTGEQQAVRVTVTAPDASSGSLIAGIAAQFRPVRSDETGSIALNAVTGPYLFARVLSDNSKAEGHLLKFEAAGASSLFSSLPIPLEVTFANSGNVHLAPTGEIKVVDVFGREVARAEVNAERRIVLPGITRILPVWWGSEREATSSSWLREFRKPTVGPFKITAEMTDGISSAVQTSSLTIWVLPWRSATLLGILILGVVAAKRRLSVV